MAPRSRSSSRRPLWIIVLIAFICAVVIGAYLYNPRHYTACYLVSSDACSSQPPPEPARVYTDDEIAARAIMRDVIRARPVQSKNPKIAFMFLTPSSLPFEKLWEKFFMGHEDRYTIYVHASRDRPIHTSPIFTGRDIRSEKVIWGTISMVDAEKRLLAHALHDSENQHFVLLSESCVPLHNFDYIYSYLMETNVSFVDCFDDPGPHGAGRYSEHMLPEIVKRDWRKGAQWFTVKRQHAVLILADALYYGKFKHYCKPGNEWHNCYSDEHYLPTLFNMADPTGIANWSVTHVDWSEGKWHPKAYRAVDTSFELLKNISSIDEIIHVTSNAKHVVMRRPCMWNGMKRPCYLFARKFYPEALDNLMNIFSNFTII
ncbi:glycosyltransferase BC10-like isoform X1 [Phragmites australis]|uniref:glycosyltransferase BC10-like isoform X1 n=2 Tax=Phragmites australis TaxID=29695 RepID=UPI002D784A7B|nr:glycosyltransferase BC10-like isoform X1 [Phragmites australis]XP_062178629.1 glycosyltransferase BC10-like isoform X1 [Phragmites australis]XP_062178630.1 glycosyltransferase BC10-like isoform X1 [Phragmites australis]